MKQHEKKFQKAKNCNSFKGIAYMLFKIMVYKLWSSRCCQQSQELQLPWPIEREACLATHGKPPLKEPYQLSHRAEVCNTFLKIALCQYQYPNIIFVLDLPPVRWNYSSQYGASNSFTEIKWQIHSQSEWWPQNQNVSVMIDASKTSRLGISVKNLWTTFYRRTGPLRQQASSLTRKTKLKREVKNTRLQDRRLFLSRVSTLAGYKILVEHQFIWGLKLQNTNLTGFNQHKGVPDSHNSYSLLQKYSGSSYNHSLHSPYECYSSN